ncbi:MAG: hypothetical protein ABW061_19165 [Polyangiaceae bacterium]
MKRPALLLTLLTSLPLGACSVAPLDTDGGSAEQTSASSEPLMWYVANPAPTVIDFDRDPAQAAIADGTTVDATYASLGVTFGCDFCSSLHAFARAPGRTGNGVSLVASPIVPFYDARQGGVRANFSTPRSSVTVDALAVLPVEYLGTPTNRPWLQAFNANDQVVGTAYYPAFGTAGFGQWQTLRVDDPTASIKYVRFSSQHANSPAVYASFDNLSFNTDPYWVNVTPIQKPPVIKPIKLGPVLP